MKVPRAAGFRELSQTAPLKSIQAAVNRAKGKPGTAILVKAGTYNASLNLGGLHGTYEKPIRLILADGVGRAVINGSTTAATVSGYQLSYVGLLGDAGSLIDVKPEPLTG